jgi:hypothetical protein
LNAVCSRFKLSNMANGLMLDTTVFNHVLRDGIELSRIPLDTPLYVTHIQRDEINALEKNPAKRAQLLVVFNGIPTTSVATESAVWDVSKLDEAKWGSSDDGLFEKLLSGLNGRNKGKENNNRDVLIAETAIRNGYILVSDDVDLSQVVREHGGQVLKLKEFIRN